MFKAFNHNKTDESSFKIFNPMSLNVSFRVYFYDSGEDSQFMNYRHKECQDQGNCPYEIPYYSRALLMMQRLCKGPC